MKNYEQRATITLSASEMVTLCVALEEYAKGHEAAHPDSCVGRAESLAKRLMQARLGNKNPRELGSVEWEMVEAGAIVPPVMAQRDEFRRLYRAAHLKLAKAGIAA